MTDRNRVGRFLAFANANYYPAGGWYEYCGSFESRDDAVHYAKQRRDEWWHVVDLQAGEIVARRSVRRGSGD